MKTFTRVSIFALSFTLAIAGITGSAAAADPYEINVIVPATGGGAFLGKEITDALHVLQDSVNRGGGVDGRPIEFAINDDQTNPQITVQLANGLIEKKTTVILGSALAAMCNAEASLVKDGPLIYCFSPVINPPAGSYIFSGLYAADDQNAVAIRYLRERGLRRLAVLNGTDASGQAAEQAIEAIVRAPENHDVSIVATERFNLTDISVAAQIARIKASNAQALISFVSTAALATVLHGVNDGSLDIPVLASSASLSYSQLASYKSFMPQQLLFPAPPIYAPAQVTDAATRRSITDVVNTFKAVGIRAGNLQGLAWDVGQLVIAALRAKGLNATPAELRDYIANLRGWHGALGVYDFRAVPQRGLAPSSILVVRWDPDKAEFTSVSKPGGEPLGP